jgi:hypothetical protein
MRPCRDLSDQYYPSCVLISERSRTYAAPSKGQILHVCVRVCPLENLPKRCRYGLKIAGGTKKDPVKCLKSHLENCFFNEKRTRNGKTDGNEKQERGRERKMCSSPSNAGYLVLVFDISHRFSIFLSYRESESRPI